MISRGSGSRFEVQAVRCSLPRRSQHPDQRAHHALDPHNTQRLNRPRPRPPRIHMLPTRRVQVVTDRPPQCRTTLFAHATNSVTVILTRRVGISVFAFRSKSELRPLESLLARSRSRNLQPATRTFQKRPQVPDSRHSRNRIVIQLDREALLQRRLQLHPPQRIKMQIFRETQRIRIRHSAYAVPLEPRTSNSNPPPVTSAITASSESRTPPPLPRDRR